VAAKNVVAYENKTNKRKQNTMAAIFNFQSILTVILLLICTCAYLHDSFPSVIVNHRTGFRGIFWKFARVGVRLSPYVRFFMISLSLSLSQKSCNSSAFLLCLYEMTAPLNLPCATVAYPVSSWLSI
jgi:hypothetical protein